MTVPALPDNEHHGHHRLQLAPLPDYEPAEPSWPPRRWSSLRPKTGPQLVLAPSPQPAGVPPVPPAALARVLRHVLEVLDGRRPVGQLRSLLPDSAFEALLTRLRTVGAGSRHALRRVLTCYPSPTALEVAAVIDVRPRVGTTRAIAAAARFERAGERWACTALRLL